MKTLQLESGYSVEKSVTNAVEMEAQTCTFLPSSAHVNLGRGGGDSSCLEDFGGPSERSRAMRAAGRAETLRPHPMADAQLPPPLAGPGIALPRIIASRRRPQVAIKARLARTPMTISTKQDPARASLTPSAMSGGSDLSRSPVSFAIPANAHAMAPR